MGTSPYGVCIILPITFFFLLPICLLCNHCQQGIVIQYRHNNSIDHQKKNNVISMGKFPLKCDKIVNTAKHASTDKVCRVFAVPWFSPYLVVHLSEQGFLTVSNLHSIRAEIYAWDYLQRITEVSMYSVLWILCVNTFVLGNSKF